MEAGDGKPVSLQEGLEAQGRMLQDRGDDAQTSWTAARNLLGIDFSSSQLRRLRRQGHESKDLCPEEFEILR